MPDIDAKKRGCPAPHIVLNWNTSVGFKYSYVDASDGFVGRQNEVPEVTRAKAHFRRNLTITGCCRIRCAAFHHAPFFCMCVIEGYHDADAAAIRGAFMKTKPISNPTPRVNISVTTSPEFAIELDQLARHHGTNRHALILRFVNEGVARLLVNDTASQS